ncbi:MAG: cardiolipin synthase [Erysipelotrichaceae bacterium]|nr:cardiolipin synthase [Erysipelotrichaceae bacterium]
MIGTVLKTLIVVLGLLVQIGFEVLLFMYFNNAFTIVNIICYVAGILMVLRMIKNSTRLSSGLPWIIMILAFPIFGTVLTITLSGNYLRSRLLRRILDKEKEYYPLMRQDEEVKKEIDDENHTELRFISECAGYPVSRNNKVTYYPSGEEFLPEYLKELEKAKSFIFMEYFIILEGKMWESVLDVLKRKAKEGVDVRLVYDDVGTYGRLPVNFDKKLELLGIKCVKFNRVSPMNGVFMNHRDHRKITVIDGLVGFTGGLNLADEYINETHPYGYWKDNALKIEGDAVYSLSVMFLAAYDAHKDIKEDAEEFRVDSNNFEKQKGYVSAYASAPLHEDIIAEEIYLNLINGAKKYIYISTPYLIIDSDMINSLCRAARRGIDVRILVPGIPDKKLVYLVTSSYFEILVKAGVKIYRYTPGFVHAKIFVVDDYKATVGTVNLDYRSLYLHYENGVYMEDVEEIDKIKEDLVGAMNESSLISLKEATPSYFMGIVMAVLRLVAPLF